MTQPNEYFPDLAANYGSFAAFAARTQSEYEAELYGQTASPFQGILAGLFHDLPTGMPLPLALMTVLARRLLQLPGKVWDTLEDLLDEVPFLTGLFETVDKIRAALQGIPWESGDPGAILSAIGALIADAVNDIIQRLAGGDILVNAANIFGSLVGGLVSFVDIGAIGNRPQFTPFVAGLFPDAASVAGNGIWEWDPDVSRSGDGTGSMRVAADGVFKAVYGVEIAVSVGQVFTPRMFVRWSGYSGSGAPIQLHVRKFNGNEQVGVETVVSFTPPTASSSGLWVPVSGDYVVEEDVTKVRVRPVVTEAATAGVFHWDDGGYRLASNFASNLEKWFDAAGIDDFFKNPADFDPTDLVPVPFRGWIDAFFNGMHETDAPDLPFAGLLEAARDALQSINPAHVNGVGGPEDIAESIRETWNQWISGLVGTPGAGAELADLFNIGQQVSSWASLGQFSWDILGIRSNKSLDSGFLSTSESPVSLSSIAFGGTAPTFAVTQAASTMEFHRFSESGQFGVVAWQGYGNTNLTGFYVNIWKMNTTTGAIQLVHRSPNIIGDIDGGTAVVPHVYEFVDADIHREAADVFGAELTVVGAGTHHVAGSASWLANQPAFPRRWAASRNSGTGTPPSSIADGAFAYSGNVPFIEFGVAASGVELPHSAQLVTFSQVGTDTIPVPSWAKFIDRRGVGGGGGGRQGGTWGISGRGGDAGEWAADTLSRANGDFGDGDFVSVTIPPAAEGAAGHGADGGDVTITVDGDTLTAAGGDGATDFSVVGNDKNGKSPGNYTDSQGDTFAGGGTQKTHGAHGSTPGGGGAGGNWISFQWGGNGALGRAWVRFRQ